MRSKQANIPHHTNCQTLNYADASGLGFNCRVFWVIKQ